MHKIAQNELLHDIEIEAIDFSRVAGWGHSKELEVSQLLKTVGYNSSRQY